MKSSYLMLLLSCFIASMVSGQAHYEVESNSTSTSPQFLLKETEESDFVRLWFQNNEADKWAFNAKPKAGTFDAANILPSPIIFAYNGAQIFGIGSNGKVRINKAYVLPNVKGTNGQVLTTDGAGNVTWQDGGSGSSSFWSSNNNGINYNGNVGIGTADPSIALDVEGAVSIGYENPANPEAGTIRWNTATQDFEGYDGSQWRSLMKCSVTGSSNAGIPDVDPMCCDEYHIASDIATNPGTFGRSVAIYGDYAVIGGGGVNGWTIYIFGYDGSNWSELLATKGPDPEFGANFGRAVAIYDDWIAVSAHGQDDGKVYMYKNNNGTWEEDVIIEPDDLSTEAEFGYAISMYDNYMAISAPRTEVFNSGGADYTNQGKFYLYENIAGDWTEIGQFISNQNISDTYFGTAIDLTDQYIAVGSETTFYQGNSTGKVYMYRKVGNIWGQEVILGSDYEIGDEFGVSVAIDNNTLVVGARESEVNGTSQAGAVYVFERMNDTWQVVDTIVSQTIDPFERFGSTVDLKGDYVLISKQSDSNNVSDAGAVEVYHYNNGWGYNRTIVDTFPEVQGSFGYSLNNANVISTDGINLLIGASGADANGFINSGKVVFGPID